MMGRWIRACYGAALFTLPWAGVGTLRLLTGRDWGWGLQPSWLFLALAILFAAGDRIARRTLRADLAALTRGRVPRWWILGACGVVVALGISAWGLAAAPAGVPPEEAWSRYGKQVVQLAIMAAFVAWPAVWTRGESRWRWTATMVLAGALFQAAYGLLQAVGYLRPSALLAGLEYLATSNPSILAGSRDLYLDGVLHHIPRLRGTVCEPLYLGNYLLFALPLAALVPWPARARAGVAGTLGLLLFGTWSRGAWLAAGATAAITAALAGIGPGHRRAVTGRILRWGGAAAGAFLLVSGAVWLAGWEGLALPWQRLLQSFNREDWSNLTRFYSMQAAWRAFLANPVAGIGWGQFGFHFPLLVDPLGLQSQFTWPVVNNFPLKILCETGLVGFSVLVVLVGRLMAGFGRVLARAADPGFRTRLLALGAGFAGVWLQLLTFSQYNLPHIWVALGLLLAALAEAGEPARGDRP